MSPPSGMVELVHLCACYITRGMFTKVELRLGDTAGTLSSVLTAVCQSLWGYEDLASALDWSQCWSVCLVNTMLGMCRLVLDVL